MTTPKKLSEDFSELFHYTTVPAFKSIYSGRKLWATHCEDLNDWSELDQFRLKVEKYIIPHIRKIFDKRIKHDLQFAKRVDNHGGVVAIVKEEADKQMRILHQKRRLFRARARGRSHGAHHLWALVRILPRPDREKAAQPLLSRFGGVLFRHGGLQPRVQVLPELGYFEIARHGPADG